MTRKTSQKRFRARKNLQEFQCQTSKTGYEREGPDLTDPSPGSATEYKSSRRSIENLVSTFLLAVRLEIHL